MRVNQLRNLYGLEYSQIAADRVRSRCTAAWSLAVELCMTHFNTKFNQENNLYLVIVDC